MPEGKFQRGKCQRGKCQRGKCAMPRRRDLVKGAAAALVSASVRQREPLAASSGPVSRVRPGDSGWPSDARWDQLNRDTNGRLIRIKSPLTACQESPDGVACGDVFRELKNPYYIGDDPALTQTTGWVDAWTSQPGVYAVAAETAQDVVAAVNFARENNVRLVVRGGGHSYLGTSNAPDSLLVWTRRMNAIIRHDAFTPLGCDPSGPAVSVGAGAIWMHTYNEVTTKGGRYVQGGGCGTVGVAGLVLGGGFGSYSKNYGTAAASLLEAEVVTADGIVRIANACANPDLFWALKGGGGGSFGVVTRVTLRTHDLPERFGIVFTSIQASSVTAFRRLLGRFVGFYADSLHNRHWSEIVKVRPANRLDISLEFQGLDERRAAEIWRPFLDFLAGSPDEFTIRQPPVIRDTAARNRWDPAFFRANAPNAILTDDRPGAPADNIFWAGNQPESGHFLHGFESIWLPDSLLRHNEQERLADALFAASRHWSLELHFQKGLAGAPEDVIAATRNTATNPDVLDAFVLAIIAGESPPAYPGLRGHEPDLAAARRDASRIGAAMAELKRVAPDAGSYVAESNFFEPNWQTSYWGTNYPKLLAIKQKYDPDGLFFARHGVGSEAWSDDGFTRVAHP
jgi:FAD/FMN-containing dehydrogenase